MQTAAPLAATVKDAKARYEADSFLVVPNPLLLADLVRRASEGMDALRRGEYDTGRSPCPSPWKPGDDPNRLCKIEQPHQYLQQHMMTFETVMRQLPPDQHDDLLRSMGAEVIRTPDGNVRVRRELGR